MIDFQIMEAVGAKVYMEEANAQKKAKIAEWKKDKAGLDRLKEIAGG